MVDGEDDVTSLALHHPAEILFSCLGCIVVIDDKNHTGINNHCVSSWFCSHPVGPDLQDQEWMTNPYQDRLFFHLTIAQWHHSSYITNDGSHLQ